MKLINRLVLAATAAVAVQVASAEDSYLYWMVDSALAGTIDDYSYARVNYGGDLDEATGAVSGGTWLSYYEGDVNTGSTAMDAAASTGGGTTWGAISGTPTSSFVFELYDSEFNAVGWQSVSAAELAGSLGTLMNPKSTPYTLTSVVPEPTSGLLMLLGMAGLALRRRKLA